MSQDEHNAPPLSLRQSQKVDWCLLKKFKKLPKSKVMQVWPNQNKQVNCLFVGCCVQDVLCGGCSAAVHHECTCMVLNAAQH